jgi:hypothetical protein
MSFKDWSRRRRISKTSKHVFFYNDKDTKFDFFYHFTPTNDVSIMSFDITNTTYREFILDDEVVHAMFEVVKGKKITPHVPKSGEPAMLSIAKDYINSGFSLIKKTSRSKFANVNVLVKLGDFSKDKKSFILRRIVFNETLVIGMDTLAIPLDGVKAFVEKITKMFKQENKLVKRSVKK